MDIAAGSDTKVWYDANCHCRLVRLRLRVTPLYDSAAEPLKVFNCNCSICTKNGYLNVHPHDPDTDIEWISGKDELKKYQFGAGNVVHMFCPNCGGNIVLLVDTSKWVKDGGPKVVVNVRMIKGIDIDKLTLQKINGWSDLGDPYEVE